MAEGAGGSGEAMDGSGGGEVTATTIGDGNKRNDDTLEMKNEDSIVSLHIDDKGKRVAEPSDHDHLLITSERERRKKMKNMFHQLHALIPHLPSKAAKSTIVDEAVSYIKTLQQTLKNLETKKLERLYGQSNSSTNASLIQPQRLAPDTREYFLANQTSSTSRFGIVSPPAGSTSVSFPMAFRSWASSNVILNACGLDAHINICTSGFPGLFTTICLVLEKYKLEIVSAQISSIQSMSFFMIHAHANTRDQEKFPYDVIFEQAANEIMQLVNSK